MTAKRTTIYLHDCDRQALRTLQARYGLASLSDALRFAVRSFAVHPSGEVPYPVRRPASVPVAAQPSSLGSVTGQGLPRSARQELVVAPGWEGEQVEFLTGKLRNSQEALAQEQERRVKLQDELAYTNSELQALNQKLLDISAERDGSIPHGASLAAGPAAPGQNPIDSAPGAGAAHPALQPVLKQKGRRLPLPL